MSNEETLAEIQENEEDLSLFEQSPPESDEPQEELSELPEDALEVSGSLQIDEPIAVEPVDPKIKQLAEEVANGWHGKTERRVRTSLGPNYEAVAELLKNTAL